ncbi:MAG: UvrD-helicase domain-containing protein [bacterium]|nr:UvrD-helicase domain-containing protein [bacterium]
MNFTKAQHKAVYTHDRNLIVLAGAGSGKTRVLVERFLALLEANPDWPLNALVAITFTKKAAGEMRDRVRLGLEARLNHARDERDARRWADLLASMDSARIDTIHGLCASLLRANAAEAGVDPDFVVLEDTDAAILLDDVVDSVLVKLVAEEDPAVELFAEYELSQIRQVLTDEVLLAGHRAEFPDDFLTLWKQQWSEDIPGYVGEFLSFAEEVGTVFDAPQDDALGQRWNACVEWLDYLHSHREGDSAFNALNEIAGLALTGGSAKKWGDKETMDEARTALRSIRDEAKALLETLGEPPDGDTEGAFSRRAIELLPLWRSLLGRVTEEYRTAKDAAAYLDFGDLEAMTRDLLLFNESVIERYRGAEFRHVMVDEFQDTNADQWAIIQRLAGLNVPGSMFVVGDEKQSIYAFRGADVSVFGSVRQEIVMYGGDPVDMVQSFRTHERLVVQFNLVFERLLVRNESSPVRDYMVAFAPMTAFRVDPPPGDDACVELLIMDGSAPSTEDKKVSAEDCRRVEAQQIAQRLRAMVEGGRMIFDKEQGIHRPMHYGDAAVLFQSLTHVTLYEEVFKAEGIPFLTLAGRGYYDRQEVWDLLHLLNALYNPADELSLMAVLRSPMFGLSDDALLALRLQAEAAAVPLWDTLATPGAWLPDGELPVVEFAHETLTALHGTAGRVSISELLRDALARTHYLAILTGLPDGARRRGNVEKLLEKAQSSGRITLSAFAAYLRDLSAREVREGEALLEAEGAVQIMSVHASKGLEFPVVVLADASWERMTSRTEAVLYDRVYGLACKVYDAESDSLYTPFAFRRASKLLSLRDEAERLRLLYVAATRAQDAVLICGQASPDDKTGEWKAKGWLGKLLHALDLTDNLHTAEYDWGRATVVAVAEYLQPRSAPQPAQPDAAIPVWDVPPVSDGTVFAGDSVMPPLLAELPARRETMIRQARHLAATQVADLGSIEEALSNDDRAFYRSRFRRKVLHDAPAVVEWMSDRRSGVSPRQIGEIVHEALRWWHFPQHPHDETTLDMLRNYAWRQGITEHALCDHAARRAQELLVRFKASAVYRMVEEAGSAVYRELPFIYEREGYIIHGVIDVLFRQRDGTWMIADYKTSTVDDAAINPGRINLHARRYHLQLGVYAEAVSTQLNGLVPQTFIHYIRYNHTVPVSEAERRAALERSISNRIEELIEDETE